MNDNNDNHGGHGNQPSSPPPLLKNPTVTIYFDGLIFSAFNEKKRLYQAAVLTQAEGHHLVVEVRLRGDDKLLFPTDELPWDSSHSVVKALAPFWLFVDSGKGLKGMTARDFSSQLHLPATADEQSFDRIFNFEKFHKRPFIPTPGSFAEFNFPQGTCYSAQNTDADLRTVAKGADITSAVDKGPIHVSTLCAIDIDAMSNGASKKHIVLANQEQEFFRFPLDPGKHYEIKILNVPIEIGEEEEDHEHKHAHGPQNHFLQFYELFDFKDGEDQFFIDLGPIPPSEQSPPCVSTTGIPKSGFGGGGGG